MMSSSVFFNNSYEQKAVLILELQEALVLDTEDEFSPDRRADW